MPGERAVDRGFTLIETMVAMALLAFIVSDVAMVALYASRSGGEGQRLSAAVALAENTLEHARGADFNRVDLGGNPLTACYTLTQTSAACGTPSAMFTVVRTVTTPGGAALADSLSAQVDAAVSWVDPRRGAQTLRLATIVSKY